MPADVTVLPTRIEEALSLHATASGRAVHALTIELGRLLIPHGPPGAEQQLAVARAFLDGAASAAELRSAQQDSWTYVGSLACGCSVADSAAGAAFLACLDASESSHSLASLTEQVTRALRAGIAESDVLAVLASGQ